MLRVAINGFGRIGRTTLRAGWTNKKIKFVAINDLAEPKILAHMLKYDSVYRTWGYEVKAGKNFISIDGKKIPVYAEKDPSKLPWEKHKVNVVIESTGFFTDKKAANAHIKAGAQAVVISAPSKTAPTFLMGVNDKKVAKKHVISNNASCTTNSVGSVVAVMDAAFGVKKAMVTSIHSATSGQNVVDGMPPARKPDLRRARAMFGNIIPTGTGAAKATAQAIPKLKGKFDGVSVRVPSLAVSLSDITFLLKKSTTPEKVNAVFKKAARSAQWRGILDVTDEPVVSSDMIGNPHGAIVDLEMTRVVDGDLVKVMAWYDNEWGYANQLISMVQNIGRRVCGIR